VAARQKADAPFRAALQTWKGRSIGLGNGLYPTPGTARQAGISLAALTAMYRAGLDVDYDALGRTAALVQAALAHGKDIHLTAPNGTDLQAKIGGQTPYVSDGVISDADRAGSLAQRSAYLPAGEAYVVMTPGSATGKLVMGRSWYRDKLITKLEVDVEKGKVRRLSAGSGAATLQADFDKAGAGKDQVGVLDIGLNPAIHPPAGSHIQPWSQSGILTIAIGNNQWAGGDNTGEFGLVIQLADATLVVDGHPIVDHGRLMVTASEASR
jgi:leucyl aminopeptidase (aminopeptidase T)